MEKTAKANGFDPNDTTGMTINGKEFEIKKITGYSNAIMNLTGNLKKLENTSESVKMPEIKTPKFKITGYTGNVKEFENTNPDVKSFNLWETLRAKIEQIKPVIQQFKQSLGSVGTNSKELELVKYKISEIEEKLEKAKNGKIHLNTKEIIEAEAQLERLNNKKEKMEKGNSGKGFSTIFSNIGKVIPKMNEMSGITVKIKNQVKQWSSGLKNGLGHVLKYAGALFSLQSIYSTLSGCARSWLSSQNAGAKQLSANIEYMKYAMGSAFAPVIQYVTGLIYQLMKAIQSVVYALFRVNIFAKASASSYASMAGNAKKAKNETKSLSNIHSEINNVQSNDNSNSGSGGSATPSFDLSKIDSTPNSIIDAIKKGNWYEVGATIGEKLNEAMNNIPWNKIQDTAKKIGTNIAQFLNGFIAKTDWKQVGNTFSQGINTVIYLGQSFVTTFDWGKFGNAIGEGLSSFIKNIDWKALGDTLSSGIKGILNTITGFFETFDWSVVINGLLDFIKGFDWNGVSDAIFKALGSACASLVNLGMVIGEKINEALDKAKGFFQEKIEECGGNVVEGIFKGIIEALGNLGQWIIDHIFKPFIDGFKNAFGIHSPSTVMAEQGKFIIQGLLNGISSLVNNITEIWNNIKNIAIQKFTDIKNSISNIWQQVTNKTSETWQGIKNKVREGAQGAWSGITSIFGNIPNWFKDKFSQAWQAVKNVFSTGGKIFDGIKEGILSGLKSIVNAIITGINKVVSIPFNGLNSALRRIKNSEILGLKPFNWISTIQVPQIPRLAKGGVLTEATTILGGEYPGAKTNPEIVTPQNIMRDTFEDVLSDFNSGNGQPVHITIQYLGKEIFDDTIDYINSKTRRTGKNTIVTVGD